MAAHGKLSESQIFDEALKTTEHDRTALRRIGKNPILKVFENCTTKAHHETNDIMLSSAILGFCPYLVSAVPR